MSSTTDQTTSSRARKMFFTTGPNGELDPVLGWDHVADARGFCAVAPSLRKMLSAKHAAVQRCRRKGTITRVLPGSSEIREARSNMAEALRLRFRPEA